MTPSYPCRHCGKDFASAQGREYHTRAVHMTACATCGAKHLPENAAAHAKKCAGPPPTKVRRPAPPSRPRRIPPLTRPARQPDPDDFDLIDDGDTL